MDCVWCGSSPAITTQMSGWCPSWSALPGNCLSVLNVWLMFAFFSSRWKQTYVTIQSSHIETLLWYGFEGVTALAYRRTFHRHYTIELGVIKTYECTNVVCHIYLINCHIKSTHPLEACTVYYIHTTYTRVLYTIYIQLSRNRGEHHQLQTTLDQNAEMRFDWMTHVLPLEKLNFSQLWTQATQRNHDSVRQHMTSPHSKWIGMRLRFCVTVMQQNEVQILTSLIEGLQTCWRFEKVKATVCNNLPHVGVCFYKQFVLVSSSDAFWWYMIMWRT